MQRNKGASLVPLHFILPKEAPWALQMQHRRYDRMDLVASVYRRLAVHGYQGVPVHALFRDEVQDFTQVMRILTFRQPQDCPRQSERHTQKLAVVAAYFLVLFSEWWGFGCQAAVCTACEHCDDDDIFQLLCQRP